MCPSGTRFVADQLLTVSQDGVQERDHLAHALEDIRAAKQTDSTADDSVQQENLELTAENEVSRMASCSQVLPTMRCSTQAVATKQSTNT